MPDITASTLTLSLTLEDKDAARFREAARSMEISPHELGIALIHRFLNEPQDLTLLSTKAEPPGATTQKRDLTIDDVLRIALRNIHRREVPTPFELRDLVGPQWEELPKGVRINAGKAFKMQVEERSVSGVDFFDRGSDNHSLYKLV